MKQLFALLALALGFTAHAQSHYWQQEMHYAMSVDLDVEQHTYNGTGRLTYTNNSPDTLKHVYLHLYFNAFQPGSMMDVRSRTIKDPDRRVTDRISKLGEDEIGFQNITSLQQNGDPLKWEVHGTILKAELMEPMLPGATSTFDLVWDAQVPKQIRRSGRDNKEGVDFTMTQWYPKMAEYDEDGWHADQYVGREFYGVWGSFDVEIMADKDYVIGGTGYLQNAEEVGFGYEGVKKARVKRGQKRKWHFKADKVHDFAFAADPDFTHDIVEIDNGPTVHLFYDEKTANVENWERLQNGYLQKYFDFMAEHFGKYPYDQFSIIQGGDGGMEYPMCTIILGGGDNFEGFTGLFVHEATHNWYYGVIGTNEAAHPWMDEGFTSYAEEECMNMLFERGEENPHLGAYRNYVYLDTAGLREPLSTPADHFNYNMVYGINSYSAGALFLNMMEYIVGEEAFARGMKRFWNQWQFKHPDPHDFLRIMEKESGMELDWYLSYYKDQVKSIDYAIKDMQPEMNGNTISLERVGKFPMPIDLKVTYEDGSERQFTIPLLSMYKAKEDLRFEAMKPWPWTHPTYELKLPDGGRHIQKVEIDPTLRLLDIDRTNNTWEK